MLLQGLRRIITLVFLSVFTYRMLCRFPVDFKASDSLILFLLAQLRISIKHSTSGMLLRTAVFLFRLLGSVTFTIQQLSSGLRPAFRLFLRARFVVLPASRAVLSYALAIIQTS